MSDLLNYTAKLLNRIVDFLLRKRSIAGLLMSVGATIVIPTLVGGWALGVVYAPAGW